MGVGWPRCSFAVRPLFSVALVALARAESDCHCVAGLAVGPGPGDRSHTGPLSAGSRDRFTMISRNGAAGRAGKLLVSAVCVAVTVMIALDRGFYVRIANDVFFSILMASAALVFVHVRPWREIWQLAVVFGVLVAGQVFILHAPFKVAPAGAALGMASFMLLALRRIWSELPDEKKLMRLALLPPLLLVLLG